MRHDVTKHTQCPIFQKSDSGVRDRPAPVQVALGWQVVPLQYERSSVPEWAGLLVLTYVSSTGFLDCTHRLSGQCIRH